MAKIHKRKRIRQKKVKSNLVNDNPNKPLRERILNVLDPRRDVVSAKQACIEAAAEFLCTFMFVFYATASVVAATYQGQTQTLIIAFGQGLSLSLAIFVASTVSGGHLNPAVTISLLLVGRMPLVRTIMYIVAQFAGAIMASGILKAILPSEYEGNLGATTVNPLISTPGAFFLEVIMTFTLVFVLFGTSIDPKSNVGKLGPVCVGLVVLIDILIGLQWTGGSMNPARTLGPQLVSNTWNKYWLYFFAPLFGALLAAVLYEFYLRIRIYRPPTLTVKENEKIEKIEEEKKEEEKKTEEIVQKILESPSTRVNANGNIVTPRTAHLPHNNMLYPASAAATGLATTGLAPASVSHTGLAPPTVGYTGLAPQTMAHTVVPPTPSAPAVMVTPPVINETV